MNSRKFILAIIVIAISTALLSIKLLSQDNWAYVITIVASGYLASNVMNKVISKNNNYNKDNNIEPF